MQKTTASGQKAAVNLVKKLVSKKKSRYVEDGFDLDLSYITEQLIGMGFPSLDFEGIYRNHMTDVQHFLETKHSKKYRVYNLCSEKKYDPSYFENRVEHFPFDDHNPPPFNMILQICKNIENWLNDVDNNVAVIHCKAGKGRTGLVICCYLIYSQYSIDAKSALKFYGEKRTKNGKGVTLPSQIRYVYYFDYFLKNEMKVPMPNQKLKLLTMEFTSPPSFQEFTYTISDGEKEYVSIKDAGLTEIKKGAQTLQVEVPLNVLSNDLKFSFYSGIPKKPKDKLFAYFWINVQFVRDSYISLTQKEIDKAHKDKKHYKKNFCLELKFSENVMNLVPTFSTPSFDHIDEEDDEIEKIEIDDIDTDEEESSEDEEEPQTVTSPKSPDLSYAKKRRSIFAEEFHERLSTFGVTSTTSSPSGKDRRKSLGESFFAKPRSRSVAEPTIPDNPEIKHKSSLFSQMFAKKKESKETK